MMIDGLAKLIISLFIYSAETVNSYNVEYGYLNQLLLVIVLELVKMHESTTESFNPKPFFRFFSIVLHEIGQLEPKLEEAVLLSLRYVNIILIKLTWQ